MSFRVSQCRVVGVLPRATMDCSAESIAWHPDLIFFSFTRNVLLYTSGIMRPHSSKTSLNTSDDVSNQDQHAKGFVPTNQTVLNTHAEISFTLEAPVSISGKSLIPHVQKEQVPASAPVLTRRFVSSLGFVPARSKSSDSAETPKRDPAPIPASELAIVTAITTPVLAVGSETNSTDPTDASELPLENCRPPLPSYSPAHTCKRRAKRSAQIPVANSCSRGDALGTELTQFDIGEKTSFDRGNGNKILTTNPANEPSSKRKCSRAGASTIAIAANISIVSPGINSSQTELQCIKQNAEHAMKMLRSIIIEVEKLYES